MTVVLYECGHWRLHDPQDGCEWQARLLKDIQRHGLSVVDNIRGEDGRCADCQVEARGDDGRGREAKA